MQAVDSDGDEPAVMLGVGGSAAAATSQLLCWGEGGGSAAAATSQLLCGGG